MHHSTQVWVSAAISHLLFHAPFPRPLAPQHGRQHAGVDAPATHLGLQPQRRRLCLPADHQVCCQTARRSLLAGGLDAGPRRCGVAWGRWHGRGCVEAMLCQKARGFLLATGPWAAWGRTGSTLATLPGSVQAARVPYLPHCLVRPRPHGFHTCHTAWFGPGRTGSLPPARSWTPYYPQGRGHHTTRKVWGGVWPHGGACVVAVAWSRVAHFSRVV
eukprot:364770-Chlamydomonas_euryale.AAC.1